MTTWDARVPVLIGSEADAGADDVIVAEDGAAWGALGGHVADCACCVPRGVVASDLAALFLARARGEVPFFRRVVAVPASEAGAAAIRAVLRDDPFVSGRFRLV